MMAKKIDLSVKLGKLELNNPVTVASGTFGTTDEFLSYLDYNKIGAIITKSITLNKRVGNPAPRIWEVSAGMLNAIGLENKGLDDFVQNKIPFFDDYDTRLIVSIAGNTASDYVALAKELNSIKRVDAIEVNISCPNVKQGGVAFIRDTKQSADLVQKVRNVFDKPIFVKLSPEAADIIALVDQIQKAGCDGVSMINTIKAMAVDIKTRKPRLGNVTGGLSGPAIKPVALRYLYDIKERFDIPVIAGGGIMNLEYALEFLIVGADAISLGTANFINPKASNELVDDLTAYLKENKFCSLKDIVGTLKV